MNKRLEGLWEDIMFRVPTFFFIAITGVWVLPQLPEGRGIRFVYATSILLAGVCIMYYSNTYQRIMYGDKK